MSTSYDHPISGRITITEHKDGSVSLRTSAERLTDILHDAELHHVLSIQGADRVGGSSDLERRLADFFRRARLELQLKRSERKLAGARRRYELGEHYAADDVEHYQNDVGSLRSAVRAMTPQEADANGTLFVPPAP